MELQLELERVAKRLEIGHSKYSNTLDITAYTHMSFFESICHCNIDEIFTFYGVEYKIDDISLLETIIMRDITMTKFHLKLVTIAQNRKAQLDKLLKGVEEK